jgi:hypothetical protein
MQDLTAKRTLVKSPPELWEELSEVQRLARHLGAFGEIKITKLEPEHTVAWEGEHASGTVSIEPSGWGTKVILTAELAENGGPAEPGADAAGEPVGTEEAAGNIAEMDATAEVAETDAATEEDEQPAHAEPIDEGHPPVAEIPPAAALAFDAAGAPANGSGAGAGAHNDPPRRRRGFWARLFAGWLVPEERLGRAAPEHADERLTPETVDRSDDTVEEERQPVPEEQQPPREEAQSRPEEAQSAPETAHSAPEKAVAEAPSVIDEEGARAVLEETLDTLGSAHHRPYSRS